MLLKFCEINKIAISRVIFEDHSAKSFFRPEWAKLLALLRNSEVKPTWSYSPNGTGLVVMRLTPITDDHYIKSVGVEPQAV